MANPRLYLSQDIRLAEQQWASENNAATFALMDAAAQALLQVVLDRWPGIRQVCVLCGSGNNGGDGVALAVKLHKLGISVQLGIIGKCKPGSDAAIAIQLLNDTGIELIELDSHESPDFSNTQLIVDALLGSGAVGSPRPAYAQLIALINAAGKPVLSVDVPSGLDMDTGAIGSHRAVVHAQITLTFGGVKPGLVTGAGREVVGELLVAPLGLDAQLGRLQPRLLQVKGSLLRLPKRTAGAHKGAMGAVGVIGGDVSMPGALVLAANACAHMGVGYVHCCTNETNRSLLVSTNPSLLVSDIDRVNLEDFLSRQDVVVLGPGMGRSSVANKMVLQALATVMALHKPLVLDADGLNILSENFRWYSDWILTPHAKEAALLLGWSDVAEVEKDRLHAARSIQQKYGGICVLKGPGTLVCDGDQMTINASGSAGMAKAGMGDVLAGMIGGMLARFPGLPVASLVATAVWMHGRAGQISAEQGHEESVQAQDLIATIPHCWHEVLPQR